VPPVLSPLTAGAILAGFHSAVRNDHGAAHRLARALESFHGSGRAILTDSGTTALTLAMRWCLASTGRNKVALPAFCCFDLVTALQGAGADVTFYDLDPATLGPDWNSLLRVLSQRPAAVVIAHLYGLPVDMPRVLEMTDGTGVTVIEDAAQGSGATLNRRPVGSFGQLAVLSFGRGKGVTGGRGGALLVNAGWRGGSDESALLPGARGVDEVIPLTAQWILARPALYRIPAGLPFLGLGETVYRAPSPLRRISALSAAVVEISWQKRGDEIARRQQNAATLINGSQLPGIIAPIAGASPGWLRLPFIASEHAPPVARARGEMPSYPIPLPELPVLGTRGDGEFPGATLLAARLRTVPTHSRSRAERSG
jgi:perosamine synthetase